MKEGDLICYNVGGMKYKTLGLVIEVSPKTPRYQITSTLHILVQWCVIGNIMPRRAWGFRDPKFQRRESSSLHDYSRSILPNELVWHELGDWFEVACEKS